MEFSRQDDWRGLSFAPPGDLPNPGIEPVSPPSPALADSFLRRHRGSPEGGLEGEVLEAGVTGGPQPRLWAPWRGLGKDEQRLLASCLLMVVEQDQPREQRGWTARAPLGTGVEGPRGRWTGGSELRAATR